MDEVEWTFIADKKKVISRGSRCRQSWRRRKRRKKRRRRRGRREEEEEEEEEEGVVGGGGGGERGGGGGGVGRYQLNFSVAQIAVAGGEASFKIFERFSEGGEIPQGRGPHTHPRQLK
eukprot:123425-Hanusia_phi.AAC.1